jgi:hypothetical protein
MTKDRARSAHSEPALSLRLIADGCISCECNQVELGLKLVFDYFFHKVSAQDSEMRKLAGLMIQFDETPHCSSKYYPWYQNQDKLILLSTSKVCLR